MSINYGAHVSRRHPTSTNNSGTPVFTTDKWSRLTRFLILGSEGGTYYVKEAKLTQENATCVEACWAEDPDRTAKIIADISYSGRAPKNDPAIFALAIGAAAKRTDIRCAAFAQLQAVCRIPTHLFHFLEYVKHLRGWGRALRTSVSNWYNNHDAEYLAYQMAKYPSRDGWSHKDALILSHPTPRTPEHNLLYKYAVLTYEKLSSEEQSKLPTPLLATEALKNETDLHVIANNVRDHRLTREMLPTHALNSKEVWEALLVKMPLTAMIRNLGNMSKVGLLTQNSLASKAVAEELRNADALLKARIHPLAILVAMKVYASGQGMKGSGAWSPVPAVIDALNDAFYASFDSLERTNKNYFIALDISSSMLWGTIAGMPISPREASACLAMATIRTQDEPFVYGFSHKLIPLTISKRQRLDDVVRYIDHQDFGSTNCSLPAEFAYANRLKVDAFCIYTDNETNTGGSPARMLDLYRKTIQPQARQIVVAMTSTGFSIADPNDPLSLDVVGFDTATPSVISQFVA